MKAEARIARDRLLDACDTMDRLLHGLRDAKGHLAEKVHAIRKLGKTLRGGFSLFRLGKRSGTEIQAIGRLLSARRDAASRLRTWKKVDWTADATAASAIGALLEQQARSGGRKLPLETIDWCLERLAAARQCLDELPSASLGERVAEGMAKLESKVIKRCRRLENAGANDFHEARKSLKAYLGAIGFLPEGSVLMDSTWLELPELLGDENDLATLCDWLGCHGFTEELLPGLWAHLGSVRERLRRDVIRDVSRALPTLSD